MRGIDMKKTALLCCICFFFINPILTAGVRDTVKLIMTDSFASITEKNDLRKANRLMEERLRVYEKNKTYDALKKELNEKNYLGITPIFYAIAHENHSLVQKMLRYGANPNIRME